MFSMRFDATFMLERPNLVVEVVGSKKPGKRFGSISRVYVGKFTKENKEATRRLLEELDKIERPESDGDTR